MLHKTSQTSSLPELNSRARHELATDVKQAGYGYTHKRIVLEEDGPVSAQSHH
jgi:hypothetical protein